MSFHDGSRDGAAGKRKERPPSLSLTSEEHNVVDDNGDNPRPSLGSITSNSSLDPYYFTATLQRPIIPSSTPEPKPTSSATMTPKPLQDPKTPGVNPGSIDRAGLVGVGDLTTPRWTSRAEFNLKTPVWHTSEQDVPEMDEEGEQLPQHEPQAPDNAQDPEDNEVDRSSPWTIEAVDESDTNERSSYV
ncbi:hypothetical protein M408DRAFT_139285, partial [Serendipita vermifera MAFF 305830]